MTKMGPCAKILSNHPADVREMHNGYDGPVKWKERHIGAWTMPVQPYDKSIRSLLVSYATMADLTAEYDAELGQDGYFGGHAADMLRAARAWLSMAGKTQLDMGAIDRLILQLAKASGVDPDSL